MEEMIILIINETKYNGVSIWHQKMNDGSLQFMGCLLYRSEPDHSTNCWNWQPSVKAVLNDLYETAKSQS